MALHEIRCHLCGRIFEAVRKDAETCSGRCRLRRHRERERQRAETDARAIARAAEVLASLRAAAAVLPDD